MENSTCKFHDGEFLDGEFLDVNFLMGKQWVPVTAWEGSLGAAVASGTILIEATPPQHQHHHHHHRHQHHLHHHHHHHQHHRRWHRGQYWLKPHLLDKINIIIIVITNTYTNIIFQDTFQWLNFFSVTHHKHQEKELLLNPLRAHMSGFSEIILLLAPLPPSLGHIVEISCWVPCVDKKQMNLLDFSKPSSILRTIQIRSPPNVWFRHFSPVSLRSKKVLQCPNRSNQTLFSSSPWLDKTREKNLRKQNQKFWLLT